ncbi:PREDICTED: SH3 domain-containing protein C23A1.17-like [Dipodomys ordii]|uniref:SH3 domain-containing protein C23A1.17-like n=1 Tax=Dipodomys ordii TaxID=10020 RepID=A0A1S3GFY5_DIPOR|nr:PREDICTED: SH3 domain-containing protein C23A1.17-like [Dipodomys ordii]
MAGESRLPICSDSQEPGKEVEADKPTASPPASHAPPKTPARTAAKRKTSLTSDLPLPLPLPRPVPWGRDIAALPSTGNATGAHSLRADSSNPKEGLTPKIPRGCLSAPTDSAPHNTPAANLGVRKVFVTLAPRVSSRVATRMATHDDIVDMDTTPPSEAVIFTSPLVSSNNSYTSSQASCSLQQGHILSGPVPTIPPTPHPYPSPQVPYILCQGHLPNGPVPTNLPPPQPYPFPPVPCSLDQGQLMMRPVPTNPPLPMVPYQHFVPQTNVIPKVPQHSVPIPLSTVPSVPSNMGSVTVPVSGGNASLPAKSPTDDDSAMDTTPPSQASIFQSPVSMNNHPALNQMPPASNNQPHMQLPRHTTMQSITSSSSAVNPAVITPQASSTNSQSAVYTATPTTDSMKIPTLTAAHVSCSVNTNPEAFSQELQNGEQWGYTEGRQAEGGE